MEGAGPFMAFETLDGNTYQREILICEAIEINNLHEQQFTVIIAIDKLLHGTISQIDSKKLTITNNIIPLVEIREAWLVKLVIAPPDMHNNLKEQLKKMEVLLEELRRR